MTTRLSGELFDLSIPSFNNQFGKEAIEYSIKYGIIQLMLF